MYSSRCIRGFLLVTGHYLAEYVTDKLSLPVKVVLLVDTYFIYEFANLKSP